MAKLRIPSEVLLQALFPDQVALALQGALYDRQDDVVTLELSGPNVPDVPEVVAEVTVRNRVTVFKPMGGA